MNTRLVFAIAASLAAGAALKGYGQEKPAPGASERRVAVVTLAACFDGSKVDKIKEIDRELQGVADALGARLRDSEPKERDKARGEYLEHYSRRKKDFYAEVARAVEAVAKEGGYGLVFKADPLPEKEAGDTLNLAIGARSVLYHPAEADITAEVIRRLNADFADKKKKSKDKDF